MTDLEFWQAAYLAALQAGRYAADATDTADRALLALTKITARQEPE